VTIHLIDVVYRFFYLLTYIHYEKGFTLLSPACHADEPDDVDE